MKIDPKFEKKKKRKCVILKLANQIIKAEIVFKKENEKMWFPGLL